MNLNGHLKRFHSRRPGDYEDTFVKAGNSENKEGLNIEEATGGPRLGCLSSLETQRKGGFGNRFRGVARDKLAVAPLP